MVCRVVSSSCTSDPPCEYVCISLIMGLFLPNRVVNALNSTVENFNPATRLPLLLVATGSCSSQIISSTSLVTPQNTLPAIPLKAPSCVTHSQAPSAGRLFFTKRSLSEASVTSSKLPTTTSFSENMLLYMASIS